MFMGAGAQSLARQPVDVIRVAWNVHRGWRSLARQPVDVIRAAWNVPRGCLECSWGMVEPS